MSGPYYRDEHVTLYCGDSRELLPGFADDQFDLVMTDPPYGVNKAEWDSQYPTWWYDEAQRVAPVLGVMPGVWNLGRCPHAIGRLTYRWTLAAHLVNDRTRGALGLSGWIPCVIYTSPEEPAWCQRFADWCEIAGVTRKQLDKIAGTSDMGGWWMSRLAHRSTIPAPHQWEKIKAALAPPPELEPWVYARDPFADGSMTSKSFRIGTEPMADHPSPKPLDITRWFLQRIPGYRIGRGVLDVFAGSGTTLRAAKDLGMCGVGIEIDERYCEAAAKRLEQDCLPFEHVAPAPPLPVPDLFDPVGGAS